jgi:hypothetical protein
MADWDFPTSLEVCGETLQIRTDFRVILDVMEVLGDETITDAERAFVALSVFYYADVDWLSQSREFNDDAVRQMMWFIRGGRESDKASGPRVMDWDQDFHIIAPPVNRVLGYECRAVPYDLETNAGGLHWWTFLGAYMEIGECYFQQVVGIRSKKARGKKLDKSDQEFYRKHREDIDLKREMSAEEEELVRRWMGRG